VAKNKPKERVLNLAYLFFCSFLPTENVADISEAEWLAWAKYPEASSENEPELLNECIYCYIKANNVKKNIEMINMLPKFNKTPDFKGYERAIRYFKTFGLCSNFDEAHRWVPEL